MTLTEKYWLTILFTILRYVSILMIGSCIGFVIAGFLVSKWFFLGLAAWPLLLMWGIVNMSYIHAIVRTKRLQLSKILD